MKPNIIKKIKIASPRKAASSIMRITTKCVVPPHYCKEFRGRFLRVSKMSSLDLPEFDE